jgi:hypothetical protein
MRQRRVALRRQAEGLVCSSWGSVPSPRRPSQGCWPFVRASPKRAGMHGIQEWLSFYFKAPMHAPEVDPEHDLFIQLMKLKNTLRYMKGEELVTHLRREYNG